MDTKLRGDNLNGYDRRVLKDRQRKAVFEKQTEETRRRPFASVRSTESKKIVRAVTGRDVVTQRDFAFELKSLIPAEKTRSKIQNLPTIGVVLASIDLESLKRIADVIRPYMRKGAARRAKFVFIPHSRSYFDRGNNDCITAEIMWSTLMSGQADENLFEIKPFTADPLDVLSKYCELDGVISLRYHGLIFGKITETPTLALYSELVKIRSFIDDNVSESLFAAKSHRELSQVFYKFYDFVCSAAR